MQCIGVSTYTASGCVTGFISCRIYDVSIILRNRQLMVEYFDLVHHIICWARATMVIRSNSSRVKFLLIEVVNILNTVMTVTIWIIFVIVILEESVHTLNLSSIIEIIPNTAICYFFLFSNIFRVFCVFICVRGLFP